MRPNNLWRNIRLVLLGCIALFCCRPVHATTFGYRMSLTVDKSKVGVSGTAATTITDYPMLVSFTSANLKTVANSGRVQSASGHDIVFRALDTTTCNGPASCTLSHELVTYTATTGEILAWVRLPKVKTITAASNTVIYVYYGSSSVTSATTRKTDVWKNYHGVWHLDEDPSGTAPQMKDSSSNARHGTTAGSMTSGQSLAGKVKNTLNMDGVDDSIGTGDWGSAQTAFTVEGWINNNVNDGVLLNTLVGKSSTNTVSTAASYIWSFGYVPDPSPAPISYVSSVVGTGGTAGTVQRCYAAEVFASTFAHIAMTYDGANVKIYVNGVIPAGSGCNYAKTGTMNSSSTPVTLGRLTSTGTRFLVSYMDEIRVSSVARDADYFKTVYNNENLPTSFYTAIGAEAAVTNGEFAVDFLGANAVQLPNGQVLVAWETGLEKDNLGFHVLREQGGVFSQLTSDLVGGSLLRAQVGGNGSSPYFWLDQAGWGAGRVRYIVQDVDAYGVKTNHGPFLPSAPSSANQGVVDAWASQQNSAPVQSNQAVSALGPAVASVVAPTPDLPEVARSMEFALGPQMAKVAVLKDGWVRVTGAELAQAGFPLGLPTSQVALLRDGAVVSRKVSDSGDGTFDADDSLEFWGQNEPGIYASEGVYAVSWEGQTGRDVLLTGDAPPQMSALGPSGFATRSEYAEKKFYLAALNNGPADNFMGPVIRPSGLSVPLPAPFADAQSGATPHISLSLRGVTLVPHQVEISWNGAVIGSATLADRGEATFESVLPDLLPTNTLLLTGKAGDVDYTAIETASVYYHRTYTALDNQLRFTAEGGDAITLDGFTESGIRVVDITNSTSAVELSVLEYGSPSAPSAKVKVPGFGSHELYAFTPGAETAAGSVKRVQASNLRAAGEADLVILSHAAFLDRLAPLVQLRESEGLRVVVDDVEAIYDDFGRGRKDPEAIREAMRWLAAQGKPSKYLLLIGDGSFDPHNYLGKNVADYVPVPSTNTFAFETAYDGYYGDLNEDGRAEVAVGRLPVRSPEDLDIAVEKLLRYAAAPPEWPYDVLLVSGEDPGIDVPKIGRDALAGEPLSVREQALLSSTPKDEVLQSMAEPSSRMVTYIGHGSTKVWGNGNAFATTDAAALARTGPPSVFSLLTCLNGFFHDVYNESLAEGLMRAPNGVAVSVWAAPAMSQSSDVGPLYQAFIGEWASGRVKTLGELILAAQAKVVPSDTERSMALLGDPSLKLALPEIAKTRAYALAHPPVVLPPAPTPTTAATPTPTTTMTVPPPMPPPAPTGSMPPAKPKPWTLQNGQRSLRLVPSTSSATAATPETPETSDGVAPQASGQNQGDAVARNSCSLSSGSERVSSRGWVSLVLFGALLARQRRRASH